MFDEVNALHVVADICILIFDIFEEIGGNKSLKSKYPITAIIAIFLLLELRILRQECLALELAVRHTLVPYSLRFIQQIVVLYQRGNHKCFK